MPSDSPQPSYRKNAILAGILFIVCSAATVLSTLPTHSLLASPDYLSELAAHDSRVIVGALIEFIWAVTAAGIAVALYPVLRRRSEGLALGAVACRVVEGVFVLVGAVSLLVLLTLGQKSVVGTFADAPSLQASGSLLLSVREWVGGFMSQVPFQLGALLYYVAMYKQRTVPRWLSGWGLLGAGLYLVATVYSAFLQDFSFTTATTVLSAPIAVQEMVLAVWLIAKGFKRPMPAPALATMIGTTNQGRSRSCPRPS
jgi:hypothetical protein